MFAVLVITWVELFWRRTMYASQTGTAQIVVVPSTRFNASITCKGDEFTKEVKSQGSCFLDPWCVQYKYTGHTWVIEYILPAYTPYEWYIIDIFNLPFCLLTLLKGFRHYSIYTHLQTYFMEVISIYTIIENIIKLTKH